jgi:SAM-dependent methyltransferase
VRRARETIDPLIVRRAGVAVPPRRLRARTGAPGAREFVDGGRAAALELAAGMRASGRALDGVGSILDLGCGSGRVLPPMAALAPGASCAGCDVDPAAIAWAVAHHPAIEWRRSAFEPPLPFEHGSFGLVYSISVFSHLDERHGEAWLAEVARVLAPGGVALLSVHGEHAFEQFRSGGVASGWCRRDAFARAPLEADEFVFEPYRRSVWNEGELPGIGDGYGLAFHGAGYVRERWPERLTVLDVLPRAITGWQDLIVCSLAAPR